MTRENVTAEEFAERGEREQECRDCEAERHSLQRELDRLELEVIRRLERLEKLTRDAAIDGYPITPAIAEWLSKPGGRNNYLPIRVRNIAAAPTTGTELADAIINAAIAHTGARDRDAAINASATRLAMLAAGRVAHLSGQPRGFDTETFADLAEWLEAENRRELRTIAAESFA